MIFFKRISFAILCLVVTSCGMKNSPNSIFKIDKSQLKSSYTLNENVFIKIKNEDQKIIDSLICFINEKKTLAQKGDKSFKLPLQNQKLGKQDIVAKVYFEGKMATATTTIEIVSGINPKLLNYKVIATYPHDTTAFTEGLEFYKDTLYESTGQKGNSYFKKYDFKTGLIFNKIDLESNYFGEGITIINGKLIQLTWQEKTGFIYDIKTLRLEKKFTYDKTVEGWGMTNDGKYIYHSDGTEKIWKMNPENQKLVDFINVYSGNNKIEKINELEWIDGKIYANIWQKNAIAIINTLTGEVEAILNMTDLTKSIPNYDPENNVLNGIAYNPKRKTIFITGKNWNKMFEITISK